MKLELLSVQTYTYPAPPIDDGRVALLIEMRGESGETYHFGGTVTPGGRIEDMLEHAAAEIRATRRRRPRPKYKAKSLIPPGHTFPKRQPRGF